MKKVLRIIGIMLALVVAVLLIGAGTIHYGGIPAYEVNAPDLKVEPDSALIAEGKRLSAMVCSNCHMGPEGKMEGKYMADLPAEFGKSWSANITHHPDSRLAGSYSSAPIS